MRMFKFYYSSSNLNVRGLKTAYHIRKIGSITNDKKIPYKNIPHKNYMIFIKHLLCD